MLWITCNFKGKYKNANLNLFTDVRSSSLFAGKQSLDWKLIRANVPEGILPYQLVAYSTFFPFLIQTFSSSPTEYIGSTKWMPKGKPLCLLTSDQDSLYRHDKS